MLQVHSGQCGLCSHFGENDAKNQSTLIQIRLKHEAPDTLVEPCGLPSNKAVDLVVSPIGGCKGFEPAPQA